MTRGYPSNILRAETATLRTWNAYESVCPRGIHEDVSGSPPLAAMRFCVHLQGAGRPSRNTRLPLVIVLAFAVRNARKRTPASAFVDYRQKSLKRVGDANTDIRNRLAKI